MKTNIIILLWNDKWFSLDATTGIRYPEAFVINFKHARESEPR